MGQGFGVANAAEGGEGAVVAPVAEAAGFVKKACLEHLLGALGDALGEEFRVRLGGRGRGRGLVWWFRVGLGAWPRVGPCATRGVVARKTPHRFRPRTAEPASPLGEGEERSRLRRRRAFWKGPQERD